MRFQHHVNSFRARSRGADWCSLETEEAWRCESGELNQEMLQKYKTYEKYKEVLSGTLAYDAMGSNFDAPAAVPSLVRRLQLYRDMKGLVRSCK